MKEALRDVKPRLNLSRYIAPLQTAMIKHMIDEAESIGIKIKILAITGGPCGGKSTGMAKLELKFKERGWSVFIVPEAATLVRAQGFKAETGVISNYDSQKMMVNYNVFMLQQAIINAIGSGEKKILLLLDRTLFDGSAYMPSFVEFDALLKDMQIGAHDFSFITGFIHLTSLAVDFPTLYDELKHNNPQRFETVEEAKDVDRRTLFGYRHFLFHPYEIDSRDFFDVDERMDEVVKVASEIIGEPKVESESAYFLKGKISDWQEDIVDLGRMIQIEQFYLLSGERYRMEVFPNGDMTFTRAVKIPTGMLGHNFETEIKVSSKEYFEERAGPNRDQTRRPILKHRYVFYFTDKEGREHRAELDSYIDGLLGNGIRLEVEYLSKDPGIPPFLEQRENDFLVVTGNELYSNASIAAGTCPKPFG